MRYPQVTADSADFEMFQNKARLSRPNLNRAGKWVGADRAVLVMEFHSVSRYKLSL